MEGILRDYQQKSVDNVLKWLDKGKKNIVIQQPTGAGKSLIIAYLAKYFIGQGKRILFVAHKVELIDQMKNHLSRWLEFIPSQFGKTGYDPLDKTVITTIQSWHFKHSQARHDYLPKADVVFIDECHHVASNSYSELFDFYGDAIKLGVTATPKRLDNKGLRWLNHGIKGFDVLVKGVHVAELMELGYLTPYKVFVPDSVLQIDANDKYIMKKDGTDYNEKMLEQYVSSNISPEEVVSAYIQFAYGKKCVLYPVSVQLAYEYAKAFNDNGIPCGIIEAKTKETARKKILQDFRDGKIKVLSQHSIIIEGVDVPDIEAVQIIRPTKSLVVWWQSIGRALRPAENKPHAIIIDHTTNHQELKMPDEPVTWSLDPESYDGELEHLECSAITVSTKFQKKRCHHRWLPSADRELKNFEEYGSYTEEDDNGVLWLIREGILNNIHCRKCNAIDSHQWTIKTRESESEQGTKVIEIEKPTETGEIDIHKSKHQKEIDDMIAYARVHGYKSSWVAVRVQQIRQDLVYGDFVYLGKKLGYKTAWASYQFEAYDNNRRQLAIPFDEVA
jgi:superfamily II DNA or RNA helicase